MRSIWYAVAAVCVALLGVGCSSAPTAKDLAKDEAAASEVRAKADAERRAREQKAAEAYLETVPGWALAPPKADAEGMYAAGIADSAKLDIAMKKAMLSAEFQLAKAYRTIMSGSERQFQRDRGSSGVAERYTLLIDSLVERVPVGGYEVVKREVKTVDGKYHSYVLLKLSYEAFNKVMASSRQAETDASIDQQFAELEARLDKYRDERRQEAARAAAVRSASGSGAAEVVAARQGLRQGPEASRPEGVGATPPAQ
jgi:hypothetical protein